MVVVRGNNNLVLSSRCSFNLRLINQIFITVQIMRYCFTNEKCVKLCRLFNI